MQYKEGTLGAYLRSDFDIEFILKSIQFLDSQMRQIHKKGYCLKNICFSTIVFDEYENITFSDFYKIKDSNDINVDIEDFTNFSLGIYVLISSKEAGYYNDISYFDYSVIAKRNKDFVLGNYGFIKNSIPQEFVNYYDGVILNKSYGYLSDFIQKKGNDSNKSNTRTLVKSTQVGRALTEKENNAAFAQALVYPILAICLMLMIIITYMLYVYL